MSAGRVAGLDGAGHEAIGFEILEGGGEGAGGDTGKLGLDGVVAHLATAHGDKHDHWPLFEGRMEGIELARRVGAIVTQGCETLAGLGKGISHVAFAIHSATFDDAGIEEAAEGFGQRIAAGIERPKELHKAQRAEPGDDGNDGDGPAPVKETNRLFDMC